MRKFFSIALVALLSISAQAPSHATAKTLSFKAELWVDNWVALYVNGKKVGEDSIPYNTEKSFNSSSFTFTATYPFVVGVMARDFMENQSGLEYIGKSNQQIGDAGLIMQIREIQSGKIVASTNSLWRSLVIQKAPLNVECATSKNPLIDCKSSSTSIPSGWSLKSFNSNNWKKSTEFTEAEVGVKDGYFDFKWDSTARLIWSSDLKLDNTVLIRTTVTEPTVTSTKKASANLTLASPDFQSGGKLPQSYTCDGSSTPPSLTWSGVPSGAVSLLLTMTSIPGPARPGEIESGDHFYLTLFNIPVTASMALPANYPGVMGLNFKDKSPGYTSPCSQGPGDKTYTFNLYALSSMLTLTPSQTNGADLLKAISGKVISQSSISATYSRT